MKQTPLKRHTPLRTYKKLRTDKPSLRRTAHSTKPPTAAEVARFEAMRMIGCMACRLNVLEGRAPSRLPHRKLEIHHLLSGGRRIGHEATVCLCHYHHQGKQLPFLNHGYKAQSVTYGPSLEREPRRFREVYGTELELLALQNDLLAIVALGKKKLGVGA